MKKVLFTLVACFSFGFLMATEIAEDSKTMKIVNSESSVYWKAYKVSGDHEGFVDIKNGHLEFNSEGMLTGGKFVIDMTSISCTDLTGDTNARLVNHLKSDDFFDVENHSEAHVNIKRVISRGAAGDYRIVADLTIKDITEEIRFNTMLEEKGSMKVGHAEMKIDRSLYNVRFGSGTFFTNLGDRTIYDEFDIKVTLAVK